MPVSFLSEAERERLNLFPTTILDNDLSTYFTLSGDDLVQARRQRQSHNHLGFALQLCTLRYLGFCPDNLHKVPKEVVGYLAQQLGIAPEALSIYGNRSQTRTNHLRIIQSYLHYRDATDTDLQHLTKWLVERALEHDKPTLLLQLAAQKFQSEKIVRPGVTTIERMIATARSCAQTETFRRLEPLLTLERQAFLDKLLVLDDQKGYTRLAWLRRNASNNSPAAILNAIAKLDFLKEQGVHEWNVSCLNPNRLRFLAQLGKKSSPQTLQRIVAERRYPILTAFVCQIFEEVTDETIDLYIHCLNDTYGRARLDLEKFRREKAKATNDKVRLFRKMGKIILDSDVKDAQVRDQIYKRISPKRLQAAIEECDRLIRPLDDNYFDFLSNRYSHLRRFAPDFWATFTFRSNRQPDFLLEAVALLKQLDWDGKRKVPVGTSLLFVPPKWDDYVVDEEGQIVRRYYELCVLWELKNDLRGGNIWLEHSRRYANPENYLIPLLQWNKLRPEVCQLLQIQENGAERLKQRQTELEKLLTRLNQTIKSNDKVNIDESGRLVISPLQAEDLPESNKTLQKLLNARLPHVDLTDLLIEIDRMTGFSQFLVHANGSTAKTEEAQIYLYAAILAQACNLGFSAMATIANMDHDLLVYYTNWYLREDTLLPAINANVNFQYHQPLSHYWGGGTLSSSDGQRFPVAVKNRQAVALPRYFGYGRGLTFYTWTSDQHSQYYDKVTPSTMRDAPYLLDGILDNETELPILEHTSDTSGYSEIIFAIADMLDLKFSPRIKDLGRQYLYRMERSLKYPNLEPLLRGTIKPDKILERWDDMLRVVGSLKLGWVSASLFISKFESFEQQNDLASAFQEYGRLIKTIFILQYLESEEYRRRINTQLNKGEKLHDLRKFLFFANQGQLRRRQDEDLASQCSCLNLVTNAVVAWNTVYMAAAIEQHRAEGHQIADEDIAHLSPARHEHINPYGKYQFDIAKNFNRQELRPLRRS